MDLDKLFKESPRIFVKKGIVVGDEHKGVKDNADDFDGHQELYLSVIEEAYKDGRTLFKGGDDDDIWENSDGKKIKLAYPEIFEMEDRFHQERRLIEIPGNHNPNPLLPMAYVIILDNSREILWTHGHYKDPWNYQMSWFSKFFVRYVWRNLQMTGIFKDPTTATLRNPKKHEAVRTAFREWTKRTGKWAIYHHTHAPQPGPDWNSGSWVGTGGHAIYIDGPVLKVRNFQ